MNPLDLIKQRIAKSVCTVYPSVAGLNIAELLEEPKQKKFGDLSLACPRLKMGKPNDVTTKLLEHYKAYPIDNITNVNTSGPFLNYTIDPKWYTFHIFDFMLKATNFGSNSSGSNKTVLVEYSSPNIAKPFHAGHMRGTIMGSMLSNLLEMNGYTVVKMNYLGDWGKQYGLLAIGYNMMGSEKKLIEDPIKHLFDIYVEINAKAKEDDTIHEQARQYFKKMEEGDEEALSLWRKFRELSIEMYKTTYKRLNVEFDVYSGESFYNEKSLSNVSELVHKHQLTKVDNGAEIIEFEDKKLNTVVFKKSDGTTTYLSRDVAAAIDRYNTYKFDKMYYVVASAQEMHLRQLFQILKDLKLPFADKCEHVSFGLILGMSSRKGDVVFLKDILDAVQEETLEIMKKNESKFKDIEDPKLVADYIGLSAILIQDLQARKILNYHFNWDRMLSFEGTTGPYLQFTHARLCSLMRHHDFEMPKSIDSMDFSTLDDAMNDLAKHLIKFPDIIYKQSITFEPVGLVRFLMELSQIVASLLSKVIVRDQNDVEKEKILIAFNFAKMVLNKGMKLVGLTPVERM